MSNQVYVMISGIKRSGSTWQANAVRLLYEEAGRSVWIGEEYKGLAQDEVTINKIHPFHKHLAERADIVLTSWRSIFEIIDSWKRFKGLQPSRSVIDMWLTWLLTWNQYSDHMMLYPALQSETSRREEVMTLAEVLDLDLTVGQLMNVFDKLEKLEPPSDKEYDPDTLLFKNHITS